MSLISRGHDSGFQAPSTSAGPSTQHEQALAEGKQTLLATGATDTPLTHSLLDTMGYAHSPHHDSGTCPISNRLLYNYTGAARSLLNPLERDAIHQKAAVDSYEQAKAYIVSSLFRIKDDAFRKVACCLVADYLGTQFLSQGAAQPEPLPPQPAPSWPDQRDSHRPPVADTVMAWAPPPADPAPQPHHEQPTADAQQQQQLPHDPLHGPVHPQQAAAASPSYAAMGAGPSEDPAPPAKPAAAAAASSSAKGSGSGGSGEPQSVHALTGTAAGVLLGGPPGGQPAAGGFMSDTFINNHPHRDVALANAAAL